MDKFCPFLTNKLSDGLDEVPCQEWNCALYIESDVQKCSINVIANELLKNNLLKTSANAPQPQLTYDDLKDYIKVAKSTNKFGKQI